MGGYRETDGHPKAGKTPLEGIVPEVRWLLVEELQKMVDIKELNEDQNSCFIM